MTENDFVGKYNFSRRMVNHRVPYDFNYAKEMSFWNANWRINIKNNIIGQLVKNIGIWYWAGATAVGVLAVNLLPRYESEDQGNESMSPFMNYLEFYGNKIEDKGKWNNNFLCWEKDPYCGRDFA